MDISVTSKGQVTIPKSVRKALGIMPGTRVRITARGAEARIKIVRTGKLSSIEEGSGMIVHHGPSVSVEDMDPIRALEPIRKARKA